MELIQDGDPNDLTKGYIINKNFNPYSSSLRLKSGFICPNATSLPASGHFGTKEFMYVNF